MNKSRKSNNNLNSGNGSNGLRCTTGTILGLSLVAAIIIFLVVVFNSHMTIGVENGLEFQKLFISNRYTQSFPPAGHLRYQQTQDVESSNSHHESPPATDAAHHEEPPIHQQSIADAVHVPPSQEKTRKQKAMPINIPFHQLTCPHKDEVTFWKPPTPFDLTYLSPYEQEEDEGSREERYVTFEPDVGGWNNIRMQMELVLVFAMATGRTLVLPPDQPMYLLNAGQKHEKAHGFEDFFPFELIRQRMKVISMETYLEREGITGHLYNTSLPARTPLFPPHNHTVIDATSREERLALFDYLRATAACPKWQTMSEFLVLPLRPGAHGNETTDPEVLERQRIFAAKRTAVYYDTYWQNQRVIHFISKPGAGYRLLEHFYTYIFVQDAQLDRVLKRFVRDFVHYRDIIFCKGALIIDALRAESLAYDRTHSVNSTDPPGSFVTFHVRRGEFQYKVVKIDAQKILDNLAPYLHRDMLAYVATDEHNKTFFEPFRRYFKKGVRFLDDFKHLPGLELETLNPNYLGMLDQTVCAAGSQFVGTWFSTFSGYIARMRGYKGHADGSVVYGDKEHRDRCQDSRIAPHFPFYMREWKEAWRDIDVI